MDSCLIVLTKNFHRSPWSTLLARHPTRLTSRTTGKCLAARFLLDIIVCSRPCILQIAKKDLQTIYFSAKALQKFLLCSRLSWKLHLKKHPSIFSWWHTWWWKFLEIFRGVIILPQKRFMGLYTSTLVVQPLPYNCSNKKVYCGQRRTIWYSPRQEKLWLPLETSTCWMHDSDGSNSSDGNILSNLCNCGLCHNLSDAR